MARDPKSLAPNPKGVCQDSILSLQSYHNIRHPRPPLTSTLFPVSSSLPFEHSAGDTHLDIFTSFTNPRIRHLLFACGARRFQRDTAIGNSILRDYLNGHRYEVGAIGAEPL